MTITKDSQKDRFKHAGSERESRPANFVKETFISWIFLVAVLVQVPLMILAELKNPDWMNPDSISYLRVAQYYQHGNYHLAVNGYWGPLFSWLLVPVLSLVDDPVRAFHILDCISSVIFLIGGIRVLQAFGFDRITVTAGGILIALFSIQWSIFFIGPDLLMSGLLLVALSYTLASDSRPFVAGLFFGAAYLTKAVALPIALFSLFGIATIRVLAGIVSFRAAMYMVGRSAVIMILPVLLWVIVLSLHYGKPTFSTSAILNHAMVGPHNPGWLHPSSAVFNVPEPGRITTWEDPTVLRDHPLYTPWSPFSSWANLKHQINVILYNAKQQFHYFQEFDGSGIGIIVTVLGFLFFKPWVQSFQTHPWRFGTIAIVAITSIYLSVYGIAPRYYLACYPFLFAATFGLAGVIQARFGTKVNVALIVTVVVFGYGLIGPLKRSLSNEGFGKAPYFTARQIAGELPFHGPVAAIGDGDRVALYLAFLTKEPYYGVKVETNVSIADLQKMGAAFVVVRKGLPIDQSLTKDSALRIDALKNQNDWPVRVYCIK